ncbi:unnamed protein product [Brachionus calyciflorus]|uniref:EF-hand domain-containing protein n=1 Tax=Brachionus calyciflorus TaxID=104777 RepID=A0A814NLG5_9BILA|nr:unnamed protein product [Brachionus calyciflorus]
MGSKGSKNVSLKEKEIELLINNTGLSREEISEWHVQFIKDYPDGLIDLVEFTNLYKKFYKIGNPEKYAKFAFKAFDNDNNGRITFSEFLVATSFSINANKNDDAQKSLEFAFDIYDVDDNGKIDQKEALLVLSAVYELEGRNVLYAQKTVDEFFKSYDTDNSGFLNKKEFVTALLNDSYFRSVFLAN